MKQKFFALLLLSSVVLLSANAQSKHGWRGPENNGSYPDKGLLKEWPANGPEMVFETLDAGKGYSSPQVVGDHIYITGMNEDQTQEIFQCYDLKGNKLYTTPYGKPWNKSFPETRTTPTIQDGKAYVITGLGEVACIDIKDGKIIWSLDGATTYGSRPATWGTAESPLVFDDKMIYTPSGDATTMVALNKETGKEIWRSASLKSMTGYVTPILITYKGKRQIVGMNEKCAFGVNPETGEIEWTFDQLVSELAATDPEWENIVPNSALYHDGKLFFSNGYQINGFQLQLADDLRNVTCTWKTDVLDTHHGGYVLVDGVIYGTNWLSNNDGEWCALDWNTGNVIYHTKWTGGKGKGSIITADGMLYCFDERRGTLGLVRPGNTFDVVSEFRITKGSGPYWAHPTIANGILYVRHGEALCAFKIK